jgi:DNA-directed RNA polymerase specialized sigma24 family protein
MVAFVDMYEEYVETIHKRSWGQRLPGYDRDDIVSEMTVCLWQACQSYDEAKGSFGAYWWSIWLNRRNDLSLFWKRRVTLVPTSDMTYFDSWTWDKAFVIPPAPTWFGKTEKTVWTMLAVGVPRKTILTKTGLNTRSYYNILRQWKRHEVRSLLDSL